jgi:cytochrome c-type biogenesis protein CcmH/NrfG
VSRRKKKRGPRVVGLLIILALAVTAALLWRWVESPGAAPETVRALPVRVPSLAPASRPPGQLPEEFSAAERQRLEEVLRQKNRGAPR